MALFGFGKKNKETADCCASQETTTTCDCNGKCSNNSTANARFIVLGACCKKSTDTFKNVKQAVTELGMSDEVQNIGDDVEIAKFGVMQTPALVIDNKVVSYGKLIKVEEAKSLIQKAKS